MIRASLVIWIANGKQGLVRMDVGSLNESQLNSSGTELETRRSRSEIAVLLAGGGYALGFHSDTSMTH